MENSGYRIIKDSLRQLYLDDPRPWLVSYSGFLVCHSEIVA